MYVKSLQTDGQIVKNALYPQSYIVDTPRCTVRRNRRHLIELHQNIVKPRSERTFEKRHYGNFEKQRRSKCFVKKKSQTLPEGVIITRSGIILKPPETFYIDMFGSVLKKSKYFSHSFHHITFIEEISLLVFSRLVIISDREFGYCFSYLIIR